LFFACTNANFECLALLTLPWLVFFGVNSERHTALFSLFQLIAQINKLNKTYCLTPLVLVYDII